ncbi:hypothetical protein GF352_03950 [archaeon]|nr:hypothetical protein [archaeon]
MEKSNLMNEYENETGKNALWGGGVTEQFKEWKKLRKDLKKKKTKLKEKKKEVKNLKKEVIRKEKRVYSGHELIIKVISFIALIYLFLLGIAFLKQGVINLGSAALSYMAASLSTIENAFSLGWIVSFLSQSGSVIAFFTIMLADAGALNINLLFWALIGTIIGNTSTSLIAVLFLKPRNANDLRHGFEIGLANLVYTLILVLLVIVFELTTSFFTSASNLLRSSLTTITAPSMAASPIDLVTTPLVMLFKSALWFLGQGATSITLIFIGGLLFAISLKYLGGIVIDFLGGKRHARSIINKYMSSDKQAFIIGFGITLLMASNSASLSLLVPLAVAGLIKFRQSIPYAIGTITGSFIDVLLGSLAVATPFSISAGVMFTLISLIGFLFIISSKTSDFIYNVTRFLTRRVLRMNKKSIIVLLISMLVIPLLLLVT